MSDIFISYKREEQSAARKLAEALEKEGWTVWWDPKLRAGERFDDVIEAALKESRCVVVMWSKLSVHSRYVRDEATYALNRNKLVPVAIEELELPFRFEGLHTPRLVGWEGSKDSTEYRKLVTDIAAITGASQQTLKPGDIFWDTLKDGSQGPEMVVVPAGEFRMGDVQGGGGEGEKPVRTVRIPKSFAIGRYPITFEDYDRSFRRRVVNYQTITGGAEVANP
jgi:formylglycine-generating enzyme required for sulfatase activity